MGPITWAAYTILYMTALMLQPSQEMTDFQRPAFGTASPNIVCWTEGRCSWFRNGGTLYASTPRSCDMQLVGGTLDLRGCGIQAFSPGRWMCPASIISCDADFLRRGKKLKKVSPRGKTIPCRCRSLWIHDWARGD